jgi:two-component system OmpR family sensor kinase
MSIFYKITLLFAVSLLAIGAIAYHSADLQRTANQNTLRQKTAEASDVIVAAMTVGKDDISIENEAKLIGLTKSELPIGAKTVFKTTKQLWSSELFLYKQTYYLQINYLDEVKIFLMPESAVNNFSLWFYLILELIAITLVYIAIIRMLSPLKNIKDAMEHFPKDGFQPLTIKSKDEVGMLAGRFNEMANTIEELLQEQERFLIQAGHELRTPIAKARIAAEMDNGEYGALYRKVFKELDLYTDELLKVQKLRSGQESKKEPFEIETALTRALEKLFLDDERGIDICLQENFIVIGDIDYAVIIIRNLIENALKYKSDGIVQIFADKNRIEITNNTAQAESFKSDGYGFGLMLCKEISKKLGWKLTINKDNGIVNSQLIFSS